MRRDERDPENALLDLEAWIGLHDWWTQKDQQRVRVRDKFRLSGMAVWLGGPRLSIWPVTRQISGIHGTRIAVLTVNALILNVT